MLEDQKVFDDGFDDDLLAASEHIIPIATSMTEAQKSRAERNRMKAVALKKARLIANPYPNPKVTRFIPRCSIHVRFLIVVINFFHGLTWGMHTVVIKSKIEHRCQKLIFG